MIKHVLRLITARFKNKSPVLIGECNQCGECCRNLTLSDGSGLIRSEEDFQGLLQKRPEYSIFQISHQDPVEQVVYFNCTQIGDDNRCQAYAQRPRICRIYPNSRMFDYGARLPKACGYHLAPESQFSMHLQTAKSQTRKQKSRRN
jgi:Fe-S-cluster containining protein